MKAIDRLSAFIEMKGMYPKAFEEACGLSNGYIGTCLKKKGSVGSDILERIAEAFPELNMNWVIAGKGYMVLKFKPSKDDEQATLKLEEEQENYKAKNKAAELIQEGLDMLQSTLKKEKRR